MDKFIKNYQTESRLIIVLLLMCLFLSFATDTFFTLNNFTNLMNNNAINLIWAFGLLVVLIAGGIVMILAPVNLIAYAMIAYGIWTIWKKVMLSL